MGTAVVDARSRRDKGRHGSVNLIVVPHYQKGDGTIQYKKIDSENFIIPPDSLVTVTFMGKVTELQYMSHYNNKARTEKLSEDEYLVLSTGEIKEYEKQKTGTKNETINSVRKTMRRIRLLVQTNVTDIKKVRWVTLTYKENMTDTKRLYEDFRKFNQKLTYHLKSCNKEKPEYIAIAEPQNRGAWHLHILYIWNRQSAPYLNNYELSKMWGYGFTKVKGLHDSDNIASYLQCYLTDLEIPEEVKGYFTDDLKEVTSDGKKKSIVKGARLNLYPANFNIIRHSKNIKYPIRETMPLNEALEIVADKTLRYRTTFELSDGKGYESIVDKQEYV